MMSPLSLEKLAQERLETLRHEARGYHLGHRHKPSLRRRLALSLKVLAERLEPEIAKPVAQPYVPPAGRRERAL
jgi:hypothetical protein